MTDRQTDRQTHFLSSAVFLILQYLVCRNVFLMGDDFMYATFAKQGVWSSVKEYYFTGNGRWLLNVLDSLFLKMDRYAYIIIVPWLLLVLAILLSRIATQICGGSRQNISYVVALMLVSLIDISIARETVWWITGGVNYLIPALLFLGTVTFTLDLELNPKCTRLRKLLCGIICAISSTTMEQFALMTIGWLVLFWGFDFVKYKRIEKYQIVTLIIALCAISTIVFAPGNGIRINTAAKSSQTLIIKILDLFYNNYYSSAISVFVLVLFCLEVAMLLKTNKACSLIALVNALYFGGVVLKRWSGKMSLMVLSFICFVGITIKVLMLFHNKIEVGWLYILGVLGIGSQIMLLVSTIWGFRTSFSVLLIYLILILVMYNLLDIKRIQGAIVLRQIMVCGVITGCLLPHVVGYRTNAPIHNYNIEQSLSKESEIMIKSFRIEEYGWTTPPLSEFHEKYFRLYYGISDETTIVYEEK